MPTALVAVFEWVGGALISGGAVNAGIYLIGAAGTWAAATVLVGTLALSQYQRRKAERAARAQYDASQVDRLVNLPATIAPRELVLGRVRKGGTVFFRGTTGYWFNSQFFMCISLAAHEIAVGRMQAHRIRPESVVRTLGLCHSSHIPLTHAKRAVCELVFSVAAALCERGAWPGARYVGL